MGTEPVYIKKERELIEKMSNAELFEATLDAQIPDDYDGYFTNSGWNLKQLYEAMCRERLGSWLQQGSGDASGEEG